MLEWKNVSCLNFASFVGAGAFYQETWKKQKIALTSSCNALWISATPCWQPVSNIVETLNQLTM
jgi:hypothetical protein